MKISIYWASSIWQTCTYFISFNPQYIGRYLLLGRNFPLYFTEQETEAESSQVIKAYLFTLYLGSHPSLVNDYLMECHTPALPVYVSVTMSQWAPEDIPHSKNKEVTS